MTRRIAYFMGEYPALTQTFVQREIDSLRAQGIEVATFAISRPADLAGAPERAAQGTFYAREHLLLGLLLQLFFLITRPRRYLRCVASIVRQVQVHPLPTVGRLCTHLLAACVCARELQKRRIRHVHAHFATASSMALFCRQLVGNSFSFTAHASADIYTNPILLDEKMGSALFVVAISEYNRRYLNLATAYRYEEKIHVVPNGVAIEEGAVARRSPESRPVHLLSVAGLRPYKGYPTLIHALGLLQRGGCDFRCSIVGEGPLRSLIERLIEREGLVQRVDLCGAVEHESVRRFMQEADIFVLASETYVSGIRDGTPTVCTEAMAAGLPVVSTYVSGIAELIEDGESGLLVPERQPEALAKALQTLIADPSYRMRLAECGRRRVRAAYNIHSTMESLVSLFDSQVYRDQT